SRRRNNEHDGKYVEQDSDEIHELQVPASTIRGVRGTTRGNLGLVAVANGQQHVLGEVQVAPLLPVIFMDMGFHDAVHRTAFLTEPTEDALSEIDVVTRGAAGAVLAFSRFDGN